MRSSILLMLAAAACAVVVAVVAISDHRQTRARIKGANMAGWSCAYHHTRCDEPQPGEMHDHWEDREVRYQALEGLAALGLGVGAFRLVRQRRSG
jgi:hypothetical protein